MKVRVAAAVAGLLGVAAAAAVSGGPHLLAQLDEARCERAIRDRKFPEALGICTRAHAKRPSGELAASVAMAHLGTRNLDEAWRWAALPEAQTAIRGMRIRGSLLNMRGESERGRDELERAVTQALSAGDAAEAARAAHTLAGVHWTVGRYTAAFDAAQLSEEQAQRAEDGPALALAQLAKADIFRRMGDVQRAEALYRKAVEASRPWPADQAFALLKLGLTFLEQDAIERARGPLEEALALAVATENGWVTRAARLHLTEIHARKGEAEEVARLAAELGPDGHFATAIALLRRGEARRSLEAFARVGPSQLTGDEPQKLETLRGEALLLAGEPEAAVAAWLRAVEMVEAASARAPEHQGWVVARRRAPYDLLFAHFARAGEHERAWEILSRYSLSEALAFESGSAADIRQQLTEAEALRASWSSTLLPAPGAETPSADDRELLVLHETPGTLWVGIRRDGVPRFRALEQPEDFDDHVRVLLGEPGERARAEAMGGAIWRAAELSPSSRPLFVAATGRLRRIAFAALRADGRYWVELRPVARLASLGATAVRREWDGGALVVGDPQGDLPQAAAEAHWVAARLGTEALVGERARKDAVLQTRGKDLLHIASHSELGLEGGGLTFSDGALSRSEILRHRPHARVVVLSSCANGVGREAAGSDSVATAFVRAGSGAVLWTLRSVGDDAAQRLMKAFYESGGDRDPVAGLAKAQLELAESLPPEVWSAFGVTVGASYE